MDRKVAAAFRVKEHGSLFSTGGAGPTAFCSRPARGNFIFKLFNVSTMICEMMSRAFCLSSEGDDKPGRLRGAGRGQARLVGLRVFLPVAALLEVVAGELPVFLRVIEGGRENRFPLLLPRDVQEEFHDARAVAVQVFFLVPDGN